MSDNVQFKVSLDVTGESEQLVTDYCILHLRERGYSVKSPSDNTERIKDFLARLGIHHETLYRALEQPDCPNVVLIKGRTGRKIRIKSNDDFEAFVTMNK